MDIRQNVVQIRKLSRVVIEQLAPHSDLPAFGLNAESVRWVDGFIERQRQRPGFSATDVNGLVQTLGSFLGEALVACTDGQWAWDAEQQAIGIAFPSGNFVYPFNKVRKQLTNGRAAGDSIAGLFDTVQAMVAAEML